MTWRRRGIWTLPSLGTSSHDQQPSCEEKRQTGEGVKSKLRWWLLTFIPERYEITHETHSVYRPNPVLAKSAKFTNLAGLIGYKALADSSWLTLVWSCLNGSFKISFVCTSLGRVWACLTRLTSGRSELCTSGMRHFSREKVLGPAKPLLYFKDSFTMEANMVYQVV